MQKECNVCHITKDVSEFYPFLRNKGGYTHYCRSCEAARKKEYHLLKKQDPEWCEKERVRALGVYYKYQYKDRVRERLRKTGDYSRRTPEQNKERYAWRKAHFPEKLGRSRNKYKGVHEHHWSYLDENKKNTISIMPKDHNELHRFLVYKQEYMCYATIDGLLLNSIEAHIDYAKSIIPNFQEKVLTHIHE